MQFSVVCLHSGDDADERLHDFVLTLNNLLNTIPLSEMQLWLFFPHLATLARPHRRAALKQLQKRNARRILGLHFVEPGNQ